MHNRSNRLGIGEVLELFYFHSLIPEFKEYKNTQEKLKAINPDGYIVYVRVKHLKEYKDKNKTITPQAFSKNNPDTINNIKLWLINNNKSFMLSSDQKNFNGNEHLLKFICTEHISHSEFYLNWTSLLLGRICKECSKIEKAKKLSVNHEVFTNRLADKQPNIYEYIEKFITRCTGSNKKIYIEVKYGICFVKCLDLLKGNTPCIRSAINKKIFFTNQAREIHDYKYDYSKINIKNGKHKIEIICSKHGEFWQYKELHLRGYGCPECGIDKRSGKNSSSYNPLLTDEEREFGRSYFGDNSIRNWRKLVYDKDKYKCQCCGDSKGGNLNAHHLNGYH